MKGPPMEKSSKKHLPRLLPLALALLFASAPGYAARWWELQVSDLRDPEKGERCLAILATMGAQVLPTQPFELALHTPERLLSVLRGAGASAPETREVRRLLVALRDDPPDHEPLRTTLRSLRRPGTNNRLFLCVLREGAGLRNQADALFDPALVNFELVPAFTGPLAAATVPATQRVAGLRRELNALLLRFPVQYPESFRPIIFVATLFHETQHFMDMDLLASWVTANRRLLRDGQPTDALFRSHIRIVNTGTRDEVIMVTQPFFTAFLESRAYALSSAIYRQHLEADRFNVIDGNLRRNGFGEATDDGAGPLLTAEGITEETFYDLGPRWVAVMRGSIRRAGGD